MIRDELFKMADEKYRDFHSRLMPETDKDLIMGVRIPVLRAYAREIYGNKEAAEFMRELPHKYYEENNLHAFLIERIKDYDMCMEETERFLPYIDNWATCDSFYPKVFKRNREAFYSRLCQWIKSDKVYTIRYGIVRMIDYIDEGNHDIIAGIKSDEYYVNMAVAWYFSMALVKDFENTLPYFTEQKLGKWVHNKALQKARESRRTDKAQKEYLASLKWR